MIFFDLDGTLFDHDAAERQGAQAFQLEHSDLFGESPSAFVALWHSVSEKHMERFFAGDIGEQDQRRARMRELFSRERSALSDQEADQLFELYLAKYLDFVNVESWSVGVLGCREEILRNFLLLLAFPHHSSAPLTQPNKVELSMGS